MQEAACVPYWCIEDETEGLGNRAMDLSKEVACLSSLSISHASVDAQHRLVMAIEQLNTSSPR